MCGRYAFNASAQDLIDSFQIVRSIDFVPRFNIAPTSSVPVIRQSPEGDRVADLLRWGLIPHWTTDPSAGNKLNNARAETVAERPSFQGAFKSRRCLIPASGFYEWKTVGKVKQPFYISAKQGMLALGGLWESWRDPEGKIVRTFCVVTTEPNELMAEIHERMPVIIQPEHFAQWLDPSVPGTALTDLLRPVSANGMQAWPVSRLVSSSSSEGPELIEPIELPAA